MCIRDSTAWIKEKTAQTKENPFPSVPILAERSEQPPTLLELLNRAYTEAAKPQSRYGKIQDLKLYAKAFNFLQSRNITTLRRCEADKRTSINQWRARDTGMHLFGAILEECTPNLSGKLKRGSLRYGEAVELADALGYDIVWQKRKDVK